MSNSSASQKFTCVSGMLALSSPLIVEVTGFHTGMEKYHDNAGKTTTTFQRRHTALTVCISD